MKGRAIFSSNKLILALVALMLVLSVGVSFCVWDTTSINSIGNIKGTTSNYKMYDLVTDSFSDDNGKLGKNNIANVGDIVTFGNYYQSAEATSENQIKEPIRWIVVNKENNKLTLLAERVMAFGSFWNRYYSISSPAHTWETGWAWEDPLFTEYYQNYSVSTLDMWLNSNYNPRHDRGTAFSKNAQKLAMRGFMNEAFTADEQEYIISRTMSGMSGFKQNSATDKEPYTPIIRKVWVPSYSEMYGNTLYGGVKVEDGFPNTQFSYFEKFTDNDYKHGYTTAFASTPGKSNYTIDNHATDTALNTNHYGNARWTTAGGQQTWWWLRSPSPHPQYSNCVMVVNVGGTSNGATEYVSLGGVRPAIAIPA